MSDQSPSAQNHLDSLYEEAGTWHVNTGGETIHAKRMPGRFRTLKWIAASVWLVFLLGPYLRWDGKQAITFDIPSRQFHIFDITIMPQDVWLLSMILLFFAILLAMVTSIAGRVFCGYFCFQTVWTDLFTWIEEKLEGQPAKRRKLDQAPWTGKKIAIKGLKHAIWILIGMLVGITFTLWFSDAPTLWVQYLTLDAPVEAWAAVGVFTFFTYLFGGHMREQVCFWLCPYARIQGVMYDSETILPTYDYRRGEPRGKLRKGEEESNKGDCIDCNQCVAVCPTGIDIRAGQQEGCITCALCIDACDSVMDKINKPRGLIRYASFDEIEGKPTVALYKRPRVLVYFSIVLLALSGFFYGLTHLGTLELRVLHGRQPLYSTPARGVIQNKFTLKVFNKTDQDIEVELLVEGLDNYEIRGVHMPLVLRASQLNKFEIMLRTESDLLQSSSTPITFVIQKVGDEKVSARRGDNFMAPEK